MVHYQGKTSGKLQEYVRNSSLLTGKITGESLAMSKTISYAQWSLESYCIGMKLRSLRTQKRLTLSRLAAETGLSTALLSKLETDRMVPTLPTLATISRVYGVGMSYFFSEPARHTLSITRRAHLAGNSRGLESVKITPLNVVTEGTQLVARMIEFPAAGVSCAMDSCREGSALVYVLEGKLQLDAGGMQEVMEAGDCACMESDMALAWSAAGKHRCRILAVTPAGPHREG
jgi:transcriptional regulator with XRE-family HTH domain